MNYGVNEQGYYGDFGGAYIPEMLYPNVEQLKSRYLEIMHEDAFQKEFGDDVSKLWIQSDDPHPNASGHALMAQILYNYLVENDPLKLKSPQNTPR